MIKLQTYCEIIAKFSLNDMSKSR